MGTSPLSNWRALNAALMKLRDEEEIRDLLEAELRGKNRSRFVLRIHSRLNRVRRRRERRELGEK